jgi:hypothetical protein
MDTKHRFGVAVIFFIGLLKFSKSLIHNDLFFTFSVVFTVRHYFFVTHFATKGSSLQF